jgi:glutaredoxin
MAKNVTIYTRTTCAYCVQVKKYLDMKQQSYEVINLDERPELAEEVIRKSGAMTVPVVTISEDGGDERVASIGWNPAALNAALAA